MMMRAGVSQIVMRNDKWLERVKEQGMAFIKVKEYGNASTISSVCFFILFFCGAVCRVNSVPNIGVLEIIFTFAPSLFFLAIIVNLWTLRRSR